MEKQIRAAIYSRVSTGSQETANQTEALKAWTEKGSTLCSFLTGATKMAAIPAQGPAGVEESAIGRPALFCSFEQ